MYQDDLASLSKADLIALVLGQAAQIAELTRRVGELEAKLGQPPKTPDNSSVPPSQGRKPNRAERRAGKKRKGRPGVFRALAANPDRIVETLAERCPHCEHALSAADQTGFHAYDHIELPPIGRSSRVCNGIVGCVPTAAAASARRRRPACRRARLSAPIWWR